MPNQDPSSQYEPEAFKANSVENYVPTVTTTPGAPVPVVAVTDPILLNETYQRINAARFMR